MRKRAWLMAILATCGSGACMRASGGGLQTIQPGSTYVAMGSSFAAGPGITTVADTPPNLCPRSNDNYAHQFARKRGLALIDVSCGGATTDDILKPSGDRPAQIEAVDSNTSLVTVTIGGNDVNYVGGLFIGSCDGDRSDAPKEVTTFCEEMAPHVSRDPLAGLMNEPVRSEEAWQKLEDNLDMIVSEVRRRAPQAKLVFVDYIRILPPTTLCSAIPLSDRAAEHARTTALRLEQLTANVARRGGAELIQASQLSIGHDACKENNWAGGLIRQPGERNFSSYHPNLSAMTAIANALDAQ